MDSPEQLLADPLWRADYRARLLGNAQGGTLRSLKIKLLSSCNLRCVMCDYWRIERRELPIDAVERALDDAAALGCRKVHFSGGEVTLYESLQRALVAGVRAGLRVNLTTNGIDLDRQRARDWVAAGVHAVSVSLDGATAATHDPIRGVNGSFDRTIKGIRRLMTEAQRRGRLRLRINTVVQRTNLEEMPALIRLALELGAVDVVPMPVDGTSADRPSPEQIRDYNSRLAPEVADLRRRYGLPCGDERIYPFGRARPVLDGDYARGYYEQHLCHAPWLHTFVAHTGAVYACCMANERMPSLGNIQDQSLRDIWNGQPYHWFRSQMRRQRLDLCRHCDQFLPENQMLNEGLALSPTPQPSRWSLPLISQVLS